MKTKPFSRRSFLAFSAVMPWAWRAAAATAKIPMGIEMYSVRDELKKDPQGTVRAIAAMGYQGLEFYAPYFEWSHAQAKEMKKLLDDLGSGASPRITTHLIWTRSASRMPSI